MADTLYTRGGLGLVPQSEAIYFMDKVLANNIIISPLFYLNHG